MVGLFGFNYAWPQLFLLTFVAHVVFGVTLGLLSQHFLGDGERGGLTRLLYPVATVTSPHAPGGDLKAG